jgi:hypothetical protein
MNDEEILSSHWECTRKSGADRLSHEVLMMSLPLLTSYRLELKGKQASDYCSRLYSNLKANLAVAIEMKKQQQQRLEELVLAMAKASVCQDVPLMSSLSMIVQSINVVLALIAPRRSAIAIQR